MRSMRTTRDAHSPIVSRYPNLRTTRLSKLRWVGGREPYLPTWMGEMAFDSAARLDEALASEPGAASAKDLRNFAGAGVTMFIAPDEADA